MLRNSFLLFTVSSFLLNCAPRKFNQGELSTVRMEDFPAYCSARYSPESESSPSGEAITLTAILAEMGVKDCEDAGKKIASVDALEFPERKPPLEDLTPLAFFKNLKILNLNDNNVSNIEALAGLTNLEALSLDRNKLKDVSALAGLTQLKGLYLSENEIADIKIVSAMTQLDTLIANHNKIVEVPDLSGLKELDELVLNNNEIVDVKPISGAYQLSKLVLRKNKIEKVDALKGLKRLEVLDLRDNEIVGEKCWLPKRASCAI